MNLNIKATGTREEIANMLRELATKLESGQTPEGANESLAEQIRIEQPVSGEHPPAALFAESKKKLTMPGHEKKLAKKSDPVKRAALCLKRAITKANELVAALRVAFPAATRAAIIVMEDLIKDAVTLAQKLIRLESLECAAK